LKVSGTGAVYHCVSRTVNREKLLDAVAKEALRKLIWRVADFSGVEVLSYCVMSNHFHVLVAVPARDEAEAEVDERELLRRYRVLYANPSRYQQMRGEVLEALLAGGTTEGEAVRRRLVSRMHDVSDYMKSLKQRYTLWYNHTYGRVGTLWSERFKSVLVEGDVAALQIVSGYIDLNPVRAGMVSDPKDYRWSSYGEAVGGSAVARKGIVRVVTGKGEGENPGRHWGSAQGQYRLYLYCKGTMPARGKGRGTAMLSGTDWRREMERGGQLPVAEALRCRVRYFTDGAVIGSKGYVQAVFEQHRGNFGKRRRTGPRRMRGSDWDGLVVARDLRREVFG